MSIFSAFNVGVNGINAQSTRIGTISDNISNVNTVGYKQADTNFESLLNYDPHLYSGNSGVYSPSGAIAKTRTLIGGQGILNPTTNSTDIGVSGNGLLVVKAAPDGDNTTNNLLYTRAGAFTPDLAGNLKNTSGYFLQGWRLDADGNLPAGLDTSTLDTGTALSSLETINIAKISDTPRATTLVSLSANLDATQTAIDPTAYDATDETKNMASGSITPQYSQDVKIIDSTGAAHNFTIGFVKTAINTWSVEVYAKSITDLGGTPTTKQIATGTITFNGEDGTPASISPSLTGPIAINWSNAAADPGEVSFNYGTAGQPFGTPGATVIGRTDGLTQLSSAYNLRSLDQNGTEAGNLENVSIDNEGYVSAVYDNDTSRRLFKIPLAQFRDPDQLTSISGNVYTENSSTGNPSFVAINQSTQGKVVGNTLEQSTVQLEEQLTDLVIAQRAYQASTNTVTTTNEMLQSLNTMGSSR